MGLVRTCDLCDEVMHDSKYIKLNAKEFGVPRETMHKKALISIDICEKCFDSIKEMLEITFELTLDEVL